MSNHAQNRIVELEGIAQDAREQLQIIKVQTGSVNAHIKRLVEARANGEEIEELQKQLSSLELSSREVRRSLIDAEMRKKCLLRSKELKGKDTTKLSPRVANKDAVSQSEFTTNVESIKVTVLSDENEEMSVTEKTNDASAKESDANKFSDGGDDANANLLSSSAKNSAGDINENCGQMSECSDEKKEFPSTQDKCENGSFENPTFTVTMSSLLNHGNRNGYVLGCRRDITKAQDKEGSCNDGKSRRRVKWLDQMTDENRLESDQNRNIQDSSLGKQVSCPDSAIKLQGTKTRVYDKEFKSVPTSGRSASSANDRLCKRVSANDRLCKKVDKNDFESVLKQDNNAKAKDTDARNPAEMRMKIREPVMYKPKLNRSLFQEPSVTENLTGQCNQVQNSSTVKPKLDQNISNEKNEIKEDFEKKCICLRPLKMLLCNCGHCFVGRLRTVCAVHPADLYLLDVDQCGNCKSIFLKEFDMTQEQAQETHRNPLTSYGE